MNSFQQEMKARIEANAGDQRLQSEGLKPFFHPEDHALEPEPDPAAEAPKAAAAPVKQDLCGAGMSQHLEHTPAVPLASTRIEIVALGTRTCLEQSRTFRTA